MYGRPPARSSPTSSDSSPRSSFRIPPGGDSGRPRSLSP
jgi:hypothetical protein